MLRKSKFSGIIAIMMVFSFITCGDSNSREIEKPTTPIGTPDLTGTISITPITAIVSTELTATYNGSENINVYQWKKDTTNVGTNSNKFIPYEIGNYTVTVSAIGYNSKTSNIVTVEDPVVIPWDGSINYDWYNTYDIEYLISTAEELAGLSNIVNGTCGNGSDPYSFEGKTIKLSNNINLNNISWTPIGRYDETIFWVHFQGTFDGNGKIITGLYIYNPPADRQGLFGCIGKNCTIKRLGISGNVTGYTDVGGIVGFASGTVENCYSTVNINCYADGGGIVGCTSSTGILKNCYATGNINGALGVGGIVGNNQNTIENCVALNSSVTRTSGSSTYIGRVIGIYISYGRVNNYGLSNMVDSSMLFSEKTSSGKDGKDVNKAESETENWWKTSSWNGPGWNFTNIWRWDNIENIPKLR